MDSSLTSAINAATTPVVDSSCRIGVSNIPTWITQGNKKNNESSSVATTASDTNTNNNM